MAAEHQYTVVVGVDGSLSSLAALRWALWHAGLVNGRVTAVMAWDFPALYNWDVPGTEEFTRGTADALTDAINKVAVESAGEIRKEIAQGHPAQALIDAAEDADADLLVVGNRGHGGFTGALLGSVSQHCVHHARCPVVVVREKPGAG